MLFSTSQPIGWTRCCRGCHRGEQDEAPGPRYRRGAAPHCAMQACGLGHCACSSGLHKWKGRGCLPAHAAANRAMFHAPCTRVGGEERVHTGYHASVGLPLLSAVLA